MVSQLALEEDLFNFLQKMFRVKETGSPAGKDNIPILQLKWGSGKMKKLAL
jgi:hypothetical protein